MAASGSVLLVVLFGTIVLVTAEDSGVVAKRRDRMATEAWTSEALAELPHGSLLLVRSPALVGRLWATRVVRGARPDVIVVPVPLLGRGSFAGGLLELEPQLSSLIREVALTGRPTEYGLSTLADARSLHVELDPDWDQRLFEQLLPSPMWLRFAPHALGRSDRREALTQGRAPFRRVQRLAQDPLRPDPATASVLRARLREHAVVLAALGDRDALTVMLEDLDSLEPSSGFCRELRRRLKQDQRGGVDIRGLLTESAMAE
jgi:hypothetical protein